MTIMQCCKTSFGWPFIKCVSCLCFKNICQLFDVYLCVALPSSLMHKRWASTGRISPSSVQLQKCWPSTNLFNIFWRSCTWVTAAWSRSVDPSLHGATCWTIYRAYLIWTTLAPRLCWALLRVHWNVTQWLALQTTQSLSIIGLFTSLAVWSAGVSCLHAGLVKGSTKQQGSMGLCILTWQHTTKVFWWPAQWSIFITFKMQSCLMRLVICWGLEMFPHRCTRSWRQKGCIFKMCNQQQAASCHQAPLVQLVMWYS